MTNYNHTQEIIPRTSHPFQFSRAIVGLLLATAALAVILIFSTLRNINRAQLLMETFLRDKGETIMRSIEAGSRATAMHHMGSGDPLQTLLLEYVRDNDIKYISIVDDDGSIDLHVGSVPQPTLLESDIKRILTADIPVIDLDRDKGIYNLSKRFRLEPQFSGMHMHSDFMRRMFPGKDTKKILAIGLRTHQFDLARKQDVRHAFFMGTILLLVGSAGLYFLFLYHRIRITSSSLSDMKLYTDNVIESIPVGIITLDADDRVVSCNHNTEELFRVEFSALQGKKITDALPSCLPALSTACDAELERDTQCRDSQGLIIPLKAACSPLVSHEGKQIGKVLILRDMSSIKEMELQLERSRRMAALGKMAAGIAHEIRNPLGTLRGFAQFFGSQAEEKSNGQQYADLMISEIDRLNQTISGLLQFSRPRDPQMQTVEVNELFHKTVSMMEADLASKNVNLDWQHQSGITLQADPDLLLQVLMNLFKNSINAISEGGNIVLTCGEDDQSVILSVADDGDGMSHEVKQKMFDPFFTTFKSGTGLGLAVSHQIIEQHGGTFKVETEPGQGTAISIYLPKR